MSTGTILRSLRDEHGWSQEFVANELNISQPSYCSLEQDKTKLSIERATILAELYNVPIAIFSEDKDSIINYNLGRKSRTIINSNITKESLSLKEENLYQEIIEDKNNQIQHLKSEIAELRKNISFLQKQLEKALN
ncbi:helix-turn-helix domain-containing protein [uncultured Sphingobacterium sp.]|uniref:helix-turn-helix domain-containing protein n=1 Tax=uncultured Sphingobacterium sp. TaxID=182688 RepID=UPI0025F21116|nr:helix-turn-helix transcriptional regulator [uncultured Sphingobacterium sp.]